MLPPPSNDLFSELARFLADLTNPEKLNFYIGLLTLFGLVIQRKDGLRRLVKAMAALAAQERVQTGEHTAASGNGNGLALRSTINNLETMQHSLESLEWMVERRLGDVEAAQRQLREDMQRQVADYERYALNLGTATNSYTGEQIREVRLEFERRLAAELEALKTR